MFFWSVWQTFHFRNGDISHALSKLRNSCSFSYTQHYELSSYMANDELSVVSRALFAICVCSSSPPGIIVSKIVSCRFAQRRRKRTRVAIEDTYWHYPSLLAS